MPRNPFRYFKTSPEIIQLAVMMYVRFPLSLRNVEDLLHERGIDVCHESVRLWVDRFGPMFAGKIRIRRASYLRQITQWQWHLDEVFVKNNGETHYLWRAIDFEVFQENDEAIRCAADSRDRPAETLWCSGEGNRKYRSPGGWSPFEQPRREEPLAIAATRASNVEIQANVEPAEIRFDARLVP